MNLAVLAPVPASRRRDEAGLCGPSCGGGARGESGHVGGAGVNQEARNLYQQLGFRQTATRARYYVNPEEDAVLMDMAPLEVSALCGPAGRPSREAGNTTVIHERM